jgi:hypothetical protein
MKDKRLIGVTVLPEFIQSETVDGVLDRLQQSGVNAVTTSPYVMEPADEKTGAREPPIDAGAGSVRLLDRPLWGKRELWVRTAPSFEPDRALYKGLRSQPAEPTELTKREGHVVKEFIHAAQARGIKVYFQVQAAIPPGYRVQFGGPIDEDQPRMPDGRVPARRVDKNGSLASPHIIQYEHALIRDLCRAYPELDGIRFDWPEYPPYLLDCMFLDFCDHTRAAAKRLDFDFELMRRDAAALYKKLHGGLTDADLKPWTEPDGGRFALVRLLSDHPGLGQWQRFNATLVDELLAGFRKTMNDAGAATMEMAPNAFPPPWTIASGFDFRRAARHSASISVKLYGMHWAMMLRFYGDQLRQANPGLSDTLLVRALVRLLDIADDDGLPRLDDYRYPEPDEPHPIGPKAQARKIAQAQAAAGDTPIHVLAHGYGPPDDFRRRLVVARDAGPHGFWINRYGYLSNEKLHILGQVVRN